MLPLFSRLCATVKTGLQLSYYICYLPLNSIYVKTEFLLMPRSFTNADI